MTPAELRQLANAYVKAKRAKEAAEKTLESLRKQVLELKVPLIRGTHCDLRIAFGIPRQRLDTEKARGFLTREQIDLATVVSTIDQISVTPHTATLAPSAKLDMVQLAKSSLGIPK